MNIITEKETNGRVIDGIKTILNLSDEDFSTLVGKLKPQKGEVLEKIFFYYTTDSSECPHNPAQLGLEKKFEDGKFIGRSYFGVKSISVHDILYQFAGLLPKFDIGSRTYNRIVDLLHTRDVESLKATQLEENGENHELLNKIFTILSDKETLNKFLDYDNNKDEFSIDGKEVDIAEYLKYLGAIFGRKNNKGQLIKCNEIYNNFYIPEFSTFQDSYYQILNQYNLDRYTNPGYEFRNFDSFVHINDTSIRKGEEPEWEISQELRNAVYEGFPEDGTLEDKLMHIYCKLCKELSYDEGYFYRDKLEDDRYDYTFSKEHLESITPDSKITCWDFCRVFSKMVNELDGDIEAVIIAKGQNQGHFLTGVYTDKISATFEAINSITMGTNDLIKAKSGIAFEGIDVVSDRDGLIKQSLEKAYSTVFGKKESTIQEYFKQLKQLPREDVPNDVQKKIEAFVAVMKEENISGNEAMQSLNMYYKAGFFGEELKKAFVGRREVVDGKEEYRRMVLIISKAETMKPDTPVYIVDTQDLELSTKSAEEVIEQLNSGKIVYEDEEHKLPDVDTEGR